MPAFEETVKAVRASVRGGADHARAAAELLIWHETWLRRADFTRECVRYLEDGAVINWAKARAFADRVTAGGLGAPRASSSEAAVLDLAVALGEDRFRLSNFGHQHRRAAVLAVAAAVGLASPLEWPEVANG